MFFKREEKCHLHVEASNNRLFGLCIWCSRCKTMEFFFMANAFIKQGGCYSMGYNTIK